MQEPTRVEFPGDGMGMLPVTVHDSHEVASGGLFVATFACTWDDEEDEAPFLLIHDGERWFTSDGSLANVETCDSKDNEVEESPATPSNPGDPEVK